MASTAVRLLLLLLVLLAAPLSGHQDPPAVPSGQPFVVGTTAVVVDVVVRDNRGNPVTDLRKEDFDADGSRPQPPGRARRGGHFSQTPERR